MAKKKSEIDVGKGFKRIFKVIAGLWLALIFALFIGDFAACEVHKMDLLECDDWPSHQIIQLVLFGGAVIPAYFFLKWIGAGFKKK